MILYPHTREKNKKLYALKQICAFSHKKFKQPKYTKKALACTSNNKILTKSNMGDFKKFQKKTKI